MTSKYGENLSDEELVALCRERLPGDSRPFTALVSRYQQQVLDSCLRLMGNQQEAEDQAQEVFLRVYRGLRRFEGRAKFSTWLFQITVNTCRTALKKWSRRPQVEEMSLMNLESHLYTPEATEETALNRLDVDTVNYALQILDEDERAVLVLREVNELSYKEVAEALGIGLSAAKMRVLRARLALQQAYQTLTREKA